MLSNAMYILTTPAIIILFILSNITTDINNIPHFSRNGNISNKFLPDIFSLFSTNFRQLYISAAVHRELLFTGNIPRGVFCEQSSQKTRELRREIMQSMISVHREACYCERSEQ